MLLPTKNVIFTFLILTLIFLSACSMISTSTICEGETCGAQDAKSEDYPPARVTCEETCITREQVAYETSMKGKCLLIYKDNVYAPPYSRVDMTHEDKVACGTDVTEIINPTHLEDPEQYLVPNLCAPLCE